MFVLKFYRKHILTKNMSRCRFIVNQRVLCRDLLIMYFRINKCSNLRNIRKNDIFMDKNACQYQIRSLA